MSYLKGDITSNLESIHIFSTRLFNLTAKNKIKCMYV